MQYWHEFHDRFMAYTGPIPLIRQAMLGEERRALLVPHRRLQEAEACGRRHRGARAPRGAPARCARRGRRESPPHTADPSRARVRADLGAASRGVLLLALREAPEDDAAHAARTPRRAPGASTCGPGGRAARPGPRAAAPHHRAPACTGCRCMRESTERLPPRRRPSATPGDIGSPCPGAGARRGGRLEQPEEPRVRGGGQPPELGEHRSVDADPAVRLQPQVQGGDVGEADQRFAPSPGGAAVMRRGSSRVAP